MPASTLEQIYSLALQHHRAGRLKEAESLYRQILSTHPNHADALQMLGGIAFQSGRHQQALDLIRRAIAINPSAADYHGNLAVILAATGQIDAAIEALRRSLAIRPDHPDVLYNLGNLLAPQKKVDQAIAAYQHAVRVQPNFPEALNNLGDLLRQAGRYDEAHSALREALVLRRDYPEALFNLGQTLGAENRLDDALAVFTRFLGLRPEAPEAHNELGNVLRELNRPRDALAAYQRAASLRPTFAHARWHAALCHLSLGEFEPGWRLYESRRQLPDWKEPPFPQKEWTGSSLAGKRIMLWAEQGFGDTLQFIRYAPLLTAGGARVLLQCQRPLARLLTHQLTIGQVIPEGDLLPEFDAHCLLMSLPRLLGTTLESIPTATPYIAANPADTARWRARIDSLSGHPPDSLPASSPRVPESARPRIAVGIAWATNLLPESARKRWIDPNALAQLAAVPNALFYSLQKSPPNSPPLSPPAGLPLADFGSDLTDFGETAAVIANLDLVITCDTAVAHLAGAMGKPTWIALPFASPWRWMNERSDSPWYPSVRLFRQSEPGNWAAPLRQITAELAIFVQRAAQ